MIILRRISVMKSVRTILFYLFPLAALLLLAGLVLKAGKGLEHSTGIPLAAAPNNVPQALTGALSHPLAVFILQLVLIIVASQVCAFLCRKIGQPAVMGEIIAGILLGPSLMGACLPAFSTFIFPASSLGNLQMLSQVGLILFMFVIGMELDTGLLKKKAGPAMFISYSGIIVPFGMGIALSYYLYTRYAPAGVPFYAFSLFTGIALSITAFPVLARIIRERGLTGSRVGVMAITAAATGDVAAWCMLAFIVAIVKAGAITSSLYILMGVAVYAATMLFVVRPALARLASVSGDNTVIKRSVMAALFVVLLLSAYCCEVIGIHALFGAFMAGLVMPRETGIRQAFIDKIEDVALVLLLPLFFVFTGLRTQVGLLNDPGLWLTCGCIVLVAVAGKFGGSAIAARISGESVPDSLAIGALMNTRGLVELVVLNIGYDLHILTPQLFTMMVIMALTTTFMTNPALDLIKRIFK